jgi:4-hydroxy-3-methylbut-2-en-1-yl diphosphate reductase
MTTGATAAAAATATATTNEARSEKARPQAGLSFFAPYNSGMEVLLASPRGFCAGVERAIAIVERALELHGAPIYVRHEIVHNRYVVEDLRAKGAVFVEELDEVPEGATVIFSAHGVAKSVRAEAARRGLKVFDATCPLVTKVHVEVSKMLREGYEIVMIGHRGHPEAEGTMGQAQSGMHLVERVEDVAKITPASSKLSYVTQTTLSVDDAAAIIAALKARFPGIVGPKKDDICYATQNRQDAVKLMAPQCDAVIVVGSPNSSNSNRLREVSENMGVPAYLVDNAADLRPEWIAGKRRIGITAGASAPQVLVDEVIACLKALGAASVRPLKGITETMLFPLPRELAVPKKAASPARP